MSGISYVDPPVNVALKVISVTIAAGNVSGQAAHGMAGTPKPGRPNPNGVDGINCWASADATNVTVTMDAAQIADVVFQVPCFLGL